MKTELKVMLDCEVVTAKAREIEAEGKKMGGDKAQIMDLVGTILRMLVADRGRAVELVVREN